MTPLTRRELLIGAGGVAAGGAAYRSLRLPLRRLIRGEDILGQFPAGSSPSFAHSGEDVLTRLFLGGNTKPTYLDVGAAYPILGSNTYLLYAMGGRGVLVEPNVALIPDIKARRPRDTVLNVGIGVTDQKEADYYCYDREAGWNTFDKALADKRIATAGIRYDRVLKMPLIPINRVIAEHFGGKAPDFLSTDVEGLDLAILKSLDFDKYRPKIICAETIDEDWRRAVPVMSPETTEFLAGKGYEARAVTYYNTLYLDRSQFSK
jgi:FkbM family methyltransferase